MRSPPQWTRALPHKLEGYHATNTSWSRVHRVILLQNYLLLNSRPLLNYTLINIVANNEICIFIIECRCAFIWLNKYIIINTHKQLLYFIF